MRRRRHTPSRERAVKKDMTTTTMKTTMRPRCARRATTTTTEKKTTEKKTMVQRPAWRNGRPNTIAFASANDSWNAAIGEEKCRVTKSANESVVLFEFGVDPVRTTTEVEDETKKRDEEARADDSAFVESVVSLTAEQAQEEDEEKVVKETAVPTQTKTPPLSKMKKAELVALCEELGVDSTGTVPALRGRLGPVLRARAE
jgi:hypothetical protein